MFLVCSSIGGQLLGIEMVVYFVFPSLFGHLPSLCFRKGKGRKHFVYSFSCYHLTCFPVNCAENAALSRTVIAVNITLILIVRAVDFDFSESLEDSSRDMIRSGNPDSSNN